MNKVLPILLVLLIVASSGCTGSKSADETAPIEVQQFERANLNLDARIVDVKLSPADVRAGEEVTADLLVANIGTETINNEAVEIKAKVKSLDDSLANLALKTLSDEKKTRTFTMDFDDVVKPATVKPLSAVFHTQEELEGRNLAGTYDITITLSVNGQKVESRKLKVTLHTGKPRELTPTPTPEVTVTSSPTTTLTPMVTETATPTPTPTPEPVTVAPTGKNVYARVMGYRFGASNMQINAGDAVLWDNLDDVHYTIADMDQKMDNITLRPGGRATYTFNTTGKYRLGLYYYQMRGDVPLQTINVILNASQ